MDTSCWRSAGVGGWFVRPVQTRADQSSFQAGFSPLFLSAALGWRSCWGVTGRGSGLAAMLLPPEHFTPEVHQGFTRACSAGAKAEFLSWLLFVGAVTFPGIPHPACLAARSLGQMDGPLQFLVSFHQLRRDLRSLV